MTPADLPGSARVLADAAAVALAGADLVIDAATQTTRHGLFGIALAGGSTPRALYETLAAPSHRERTDWRRWEVFFGDERACPPDDASSNHHLARTTLLDHVDVVAGNVHRMEADDPDLDAAAQRYSDLLAERRGDGRGTPRLDLVLLGLGENGHTASLFPGDPSLDVGDAWATRARGDYAPFDRITVTFPLINAARRVLFLVVGAAKGQALRDVVSGAAPATRVRPEDGSLVWLLDTAAAEAMA